MLDSKNLFTRYGLSKLDRLATPKMIPAREFEFPFSSTVHLVDVDNPTGYISKEYLFFNANKDIKVKTLLEYNGVTLGRFKFTPAKGRELIKENASIKDPDFSFLRMESNKFTLNRNSLLILNYNGLHVSNTYEATPLNPYYSMMNTLTTMVNGINKSVRNNFIPLSISMSTFQVMERISGIKVSTRIVNKVPSYNMFIFMELWKLLTPEYREDSVFSKIKPDAMRKTTFLFHMGENLALIDLFSLMSSIKEYENITQIVDGVEVPVFDYPIQKRNALDIRKLFYNFLKTIYLSIPSLEVEPEAELTTTPENTSEDKINEVLNKIETDDNEETDILETDEDVSKADIENLNIDNEVKDMEELLYKDKDDKTGLLKKIETLDNFKLISPAKKDRLEKLLEEQDNIEINISGSTFKLGDLKKPISTELTVNDYSVGDSATILDKQMLSNPIGALDKKIITEELSKHIVSALLAPQKTSYIIRNIEVIEQDSILGGSYEFKVELENLDSGRDSFKLIIPKVDSESVLRMSGNNYFMRKQKTDRPIRKINQNEVRLTSGYGKLSISKAYAKRYEIHYWLKSLLSKRYNNGSVENLVTVAGKNKLSDVNLPLHYSFFNRYIKSFIYNGIKYNFNYKGRFSLDEKLDPKLEDSYGILFASKGNKRYFIQHSNVVIEYDVKTEEAVETANLLDILEIDIGKAPVPASTIKIFRTDIPLGIMLSYYLGFTKLLKLYKAEYEELAPNGRSKLTKPYYSIMFKDIKINIVRDFGERDIVFGGLASMNKVLKVLHRASIESKDGFSGVFNSMNLPLLHVNEIKDLDNVFLDPMTITRLKKLKEPTTFTGLLIRSAEILVDDNFVHPKDIEGELIRSYDRIGSIVYSEVTKAMRAQKNRSEFGKSKLAINPYSILAKINEDSTVVLMDDINPLAALKQTEDVSYLGHGGRSKDSMSTETRILHPSEIGIISEAGVDSGDVGIKAYLSANPLLNNTLGIPDKIDIEKDGWSRILSTSAMLSPFAINDDSKRLVFTGVQSSHVISVDKMQMPYVITPYATIMANRVNSKFATSAERDGIVTEVSNRQVKVNYTAVRNISFIVDTDVFKDCGVLKEYFIPNSKVSLYEYQGILPSLSEDEMVICIASEKNEQEFKDILKPISNPKYLSTYTKGKIKKDLVKFLDSDLEKQLKALSKNLKLKNEVKTYKLYTWFGKEESGSTHRHQLVSNVKKNQTVSKGDILTYDKTFFMPNPYDRTRVVYLQGRTARVAFEERIETYEDSGRISKNMVNDFTTTSIKVKSKTVTVKDKLVDMVKIGDKVEYDTPLFTIVDKDLSFTDDARAMEIIQSIKNVSPNAGIKGTVEDIVFYYNSELEDIDPELRKYIEESDAKLINKLGYPGKVNASYSIKGKPLLEDEIEVKIYISVKDDLGIADKLILGNQLKFTVGDIMEPMYGEDGEEIDLVFSVIGDSNRIVLSARRMGMLSTYNKLTTKKIVNDYFS